MERVTIYVNGVGFAMLPIDGGSFMMGATVEQRGEAWDNEKPIRNVTLSPYYLSETVVTQALWEATMQETSESDGNLPVTGKSWDEWQEFIDKLNELTCKNFRMPTEAEWENAARGGNRGHGYKFAGSNNINDVAWYDANSGSCVHPVRQKQPNELGLYDMTGNVFEWCFDWYGQYGEDPETDPAGPMNGSQRVYRGGAFSYYQRGCRLSCRFSIEPYGKDYGKIGLRLAMSEGTNEPYVYSPKTSSLGGQVTHKNPNQGKVGKESGNRTGESQHETNNSYRSNGKGKKKIWPWIVAPVGGVFLLLFIIILLAALAGEEGEQEKPVIVDNGSTQKVTQVETPKPETLKKTVDITMMNSKITRLGKEIEAAKASGKPLYNYATDYTEGIMILDSINYYSEQVKQNKDAYNSNDYNTIVGRIDSLKTKSMDYVDAVIKTQTDNKNKSTIASVKSDSEHAIQQLQEWKTKQQ